MAKYTTREKLIAIALIRQLKEIIKNVDNPHLTPLPGVKGLRVAELETLEHKFNLEEVLDNEADNLPK